MKHHVDSALVYHYKTAATHSHTKPKFTNSQDEGIHTHGKFHAAFTKQNSQVLILTITFGLGYAGNVLDKPVNNIPGHAVNHAGMGPVRNLTAWMLKCDWGYDACYSMDACDSNGEVGEQSPLCWEHCKCVATNATSTQTYFISQLFCKSS